MKHFKPSQSNGPAGSTGGVHDSVQLRNDASASICALLHAPSSSSQIRILIDPVGAEGDDGEDGEDGEEGEDGDDGDDGEEGDDGDDGDTLTQPCSNEQPMLSCVSVRGSLGCTILICPLKFGDSRSKYVYVRP